MTATKVDELRQQAEELLKQAEQLTVENSLEIIVEKVVEEITNDYNEKSKERAIEITSQKVRVADALREAFGSSSEVVLRTEVCEYDATYILGTYSIMAIVNDMYSKYAGERKRLDDVETVKRIVELLNANEDFAKLFIAKVYVRANGSSAEVEPNFIGEKVIVKYDLVRVALALAPGDSLYIDVHFPRNRKEPQFRCGALTGMYRYMGAKKILEYCESANARIQRKREKASEIDQMLEAMAPIVRQYQEALSSEWLVQTAIKYSYNRYTKTSTPFIHFEARKDDTVLEGNYHTMVDVTDPERVNLVCRTFVTIDRGLEVLKQLDVQ